MTIQARIARRGVACHRHRCRRWMTFPLCFRPNGPAQSSPGAKRWRRLRRHRAALGKLLRPGWGFDGFLGTGYLERRSAAAPLRLPQAGLFGPLRGDSCSSCCRSPKTSCRWPPESARIGARLEQEQPRLKNGSRARRDVRRFEVFS